MTLTQELAHEARAFFAPRPDRTVTAWAEENVFLPSSVTQNAGQYSTAHCAYVRELVEDFRNPAVEESANAWAAQVFKSTALFVGLGYRIDQQPANAMYVVPTYAMAQSFSETKWQPIIESSPALLRHKPKDKDRFKNLEQQYDTSNLYFVGSGSESNLKGRSVEILVLDEIDDIEARWAKRGKSGVAMLVSRVKSYAGSKIIKCGTPTETRGAIWQAFLEGDRRLFFVDCTCCKGKPFALEFDPEYTRRWFPEVNASRVVWDKGAKKPDDTYDFEHVRKSAAVECPNCKAWLTQEKLPAMIAAGRWIATNPNAPAGKISRRLPSMYSPHEACTVGKLAVKFLQCRGTPGGLRNFLNEELALPFVPTASTVTETDIRAVVQSSPEYLRGEIVRDHVALLCMATDVNQGMFSWVVRAFFGDGASALIDYGKALSWSAVKDIASTAYRIKGSGEIAPMFCLIDSGWRTKINYGVYDFVLANPGGKFIAVKGATRSQGLRKTVEESDVEHKGQNIRLVRFDDPALKHDLYLSKIKARDSKWWLPRNTGPDYEAELSDEYLRSGEWDTRSGENHLGDAEKMTLVIPAYVESLFGVGALQKLADMLKAKVTTVG